MSQHPGVRPDGSLDPDYHARIYQNNSSAPLRPPYPAQPYPTQPYPAQHYPAQPYSPLYPAVPQQHPGAAQPSIAYQTYAPQSQQQAYPPQQQLQRPHNPHPPQPAPFQQEQHLPPLPHPPHPPHPPHQPYASYPPHPPARATYTTSTPSQGLPRANGYAANPPPPPQSQVAGSSMTSSFSPSGRKKALLVGINYSGTPNALRGCVRDVSFVHHLLMSKFGFRSKDFVVLTDEDPHIRGVRKGSPTRKVILDSLKWVVADSRPGDSLWFSFSGHGSQVRDKNGDESDGYDETILPVDYKRAGQIVDDELYAIVRRVARGARLTVLLDACHSGTGLDLPYQHDVFGTGSGQRVQGSSKGISGIGSSLFGVAGALLNGDPNGALKAGLNLATGGRRKKKRPTRPDPNAGEVLLFAGCKDDQTSADTSKLSGGLSTGAMTYALIETIEHSTVGDWRNYTYRRMLHTMRQKLRAQRMTQVPQFSTSHPFDLNSKFML